MTGVPRDLAAGLATAYSLERELGRGGMATVFLARDLKHKRPVALKVLHPELSQALGPERFRREIDTAARLQHPHILTVHDSGEAGGRLWYTMPFVEGESLRDRLRRERQLPVDEALRIAREAALALDYAHRHGVIHRDVKPENLLLSADGDTLVADFGIARSLEGADDALTQTGVVIGTPAYMSPEQASGEAALDARSDVYALGSVLYEMLAGEPPFTGPTAQAITAKRFRDPVPSVRRVRSSVPEGVDRALQRALAPVPADRFATAAAFEKALAASADRQDTSDAHPRRIGVLVGTAVLLTLALAAIFAWTRRAVPAQEGTKRIAVLPFENLGDSSDAYFADGLTDAIRGKLAAVPGFEVIASTSTSEYRGTAKSPSQIARELGVRYLLLGRVRWDKGGNISRIEVSPELIELALAGAPATRWQQPFSAALTGIFEVQADIATRVASALDVALAAETRSRIAARPTASLEAYDAFLQGQEVERRFGPLGAGRSAERFYEQAVALDPGFAAAWAGLSRMRSFLHSAGFVDSAYARQALEAAERAIALAPESPDGYDALATYHDAVTNDNARAREAAVEALRLAPGDADALQSLALAEQEQGRWEASVRLLDRALAVDPRSVRIHTRMGRTLQWLRRYPEAQASFDRALALGSSDVLLMEYRAMLRLAVGDLDGARALLQDPPEGVTADQFVATIANYWDLGWALSDEQQQRLLQLDPQPFDGDVGGWGLSLTQVAAIRGDMGRARALADSARVALEQRTASAPDDAQSHSLLGVALAYLGRRTEAIRAGERGRDLLPISRDGEDGPYQQHQLARIYILVGEPDRALDQLEPLLKLPYFLSPGWLRIDPTFAPLRGNPRFERLARDPD